MGSPLPKIEDVAVLSRASGGRYKKGHLGEDFRERERIKRKVNRWKAKLEKMPILERRAVSAALAEISDDGSARSHNARTNYAPDQP